MSKKSTPKYLHSFSLKSLVGDFVEQTEEYIVDGEKGILIKYFHIDKKNGKKKIVIKGNKDGSFSVKEGDKDKSLSKDEIVKMIKGDKDLKFAEDFLKTQKGGAWLNRTKKSSKKSSKKASKKSSKKSSKGGAKKGSKKSSKKASKKSSKKLFKKH